jgi:glycerol-3-phosphate acyltransferase PlsY
MSIGSPWAELTLVLGAYILGGIPFGWLTARIFKGVDLRTIGSGGTGATNCARLWEKTNGVWIFLLVFALDFAKGLFGAWFNAESAATAGAWLGADADGLTIQVACGLAAILGHIFTPDLGFRGGKGVATTFGVVTALAPLSALYGVGFWGALVLLTKYMSLGSIVAMLSVPITYWLEWGSDAFRGRLGVTLFLVVAAATVVWRHRGNIRRLLAGSERRVGDANQRL